MNPSELDGVRRQHVRARERHKKAYREACRIKRRMAVLDVRMRRDTKIIDECGEIMEVHGLKF